MLRDPRLRYTNKFTLLQSRDLVARAFEEIHAREVSTAKINEIVAHISQAKAYFAASSSSDELVRPLLQYYGVLASVRAFLLLKSPGLRETALSPRHGLTAVEWKNHFSLGGGWLDARLRIDGGTFSELAEITENSRIIEVSRSNLADLELKIPGTAAYPASYEFLVRDIVARLPGEAALFEAILDVPAATWACNIRDWGEGSVFEITSNSKGLPGVEQVQRLFNLGPDTSVRRESVLFAGWGPTEQLTFLVPCAAEALTPHLKNVSEIDTAPHLVLPLPDDVVMSPISLQVAASYSLGMLVRYFPTQWMSLLGRASGDGILPLIRSISDDIADFPRMVTRYL